MMATNDLKSSMETYENFIKLLRISVPMIALITLIVVLAIAE